MQYDGWKIVVGFLSGNLVAEGPTPTREQCDRLAQQTQAAIEARFPGAEVEVPWQNASGCLPSPLQPHAFASEGWTGPASDEDRVADEAREIGDKVWEAGRWWDE